PLELGACSAAHAHVLEARDEAVEQARLSYAALALDEDQRARSSQRTACSGGELVKLGGASDERDRSGLESGLLRDPVGAGGQTFQLVLTEGRAPVGFWLLD